MTNYVVEPKSRKQLRDLANLLRRQLGLENRLKIPIVELLDILQEVFEGFSYEIVPDDALPVDIHAQTDVITGHIVIKESIYDRASDGEGRDRMTIAHEIAHFFLLCFCGLKLQRNFKQTKVEAFRDPEWQAKCFAGEFMISYDLTVNMKPIEITNACGVSYEAAHYQATHR